MRPRERQRNTALARLPIYIQDRIPLVFASPSHHWRPTCLLIADIYPHVTARQSQTNAPRDLARAYYQDSPTCYTTTRQHPHTTTAKMVKERTKQFGGGPRPGFARPQPTASQSQTASPSAARATHLGIGLGKGAAGLGLGKGKGIRRHQSVHSFLYGRRNYRLSSPGKYSATLFKASLRGTFGRYTSIAQVAKLGFYVHFTSLILVSLLMPLSRRLARRGGVKRISATIYDEVRQALKSRLSDVSLSSLDHAPNPRLTCT